MKKKSRKPKKTLDRERGGAILDSQFSESNQPRNNSVHGSAQVSRDGDNKVIAPETIRYFEAQDESLRYLDEEWGRLEREYAGLFIVVANKQVIDSFKSRRKAENCRSKHGDDAIVWFIDDPVEAYIS